MQVSFFADLLYYRIAAGSTRYAAELVRHLDALPGVDLRLFSLHPREVIDRVAAERDYPPAQSVTSRIPRPLQYLLWNAAVLLDPSPWLPQGVEVVHSPNLLVPPCRDARLVVSVLDLSFKLFPSYHTRWLRTIIGLGLRRAAREADALIAISEHTARDLIRLTGVAKERVHVVPLAADQRFTPTHDPSVLRRHGIDAPYVLYVGTLEPRKNLPALLHAFAQLKRTDHKLVIAGAKGWMYREIYDIVKQLRLAPRVIFTGFVPDEDMAALLSGATAFAYPSVYEGFGLPVLEAMSCGTPVITTNASSLPEVAGDAALLVDPSDMEGLRRGLDRLLSDPALREELRGRGLDRSSRFNWRSTAEQTAEVYRAVVAGTR